LGDQLSNVLEFNQHKQTFARVFQAQLVNPWKKSGNRDYWTFEEQFAD
jgi:hypothetical protein